MADSSEHEFTDRASKHDPGSVVLSDIWSEFAPSFPALIAKSRQMVAAVSQLGDCVGDFEIRGLLGEGAFGKVFLARQISLDREVALKVTANLGHEGRTMARLEHANVVQVFSETVDQDLNLRLLCMQYVPGATLGQIIQRLQKRPIDQRDGETILEIIDELSSRPATLDPSSLRDRELLQACTRDEAACRIVQQLAKALAYAHGKNVLHRDIKPANSIVNQYGQPMLTDFSLSFPTTGIANIGAAVFGGTLGYMAPEHLDALHPNHATGPDAVRERADLLARRRAARSADRNAANSDG